MRIRATGTLLVLTAALVLFPTAALGGTPAENKAFAKQLTSFIKPVFKKKAPKLVLGLVTCNVPSDGTVVKCKAHFSDPPAKANVLYAIRATLQETGTIKWTTTGSPVCSMAKTGAKFPCNG
ncbi:MAG TPA: hypothetical protein VGM80_06865 [Gaiellaceae bacterium]|jgi:hypothetical protein